MVLRKFSPEASEALAREIVRFVQLLRERKLFKAPGIAESLEWARAVVALGEHALSVTVVDETLGVLLKYEEDLHGVRNELPALMTAMTSQGLGA